MVDVPVVGDVLRWAREFRGLTEQEAADKLGISLDDLRAYESEKRRPTYTVFELFSVRYQLPEATLFCKTRPKEPEMPNDYRTFPGQRPKHSFDFRVALSHIHGLQAYLRELSDEDDEFERANLPLYRKSSDPRQQGEEERRRLELTVDEQRSWRSNEGFKKWRALIEAQGVAVYLKKFDPNDSVGFTIYDDAALPAIVINKHEDLMEKRVFTLLHEYAHLMIRDPALSDHNPKNPVEAYCNKFAAGMLVPAEAARAVLPYWPNEPIDWDRGVVRDGAAELKVSQQVFALALEEIGVAPEGFFGRFYHGAQKRATTPRSGGNYVATRLYEIGGRFTSAVLSALGRHVIGEAEAAEALGISPEQFPAVQSVSTRNELVGIER